MFGILIRDTLLFFSFLSFSQVDFASAWDLNLNLNGWIGLYHGYESKAFVWNELLFLFAFSCVYFPIRFMYCTYISGCSISRVFLLRWGMYTLPTVKS